MSTIEISQNEKSIAEKSPKPIKRKIETTSSAYANDKNELDPIKSAVKRQKTFPSIEVEEKQSDKSIKTSNDPVSSDIRKNMENNFRKHPCLHLLYKLIYESCGMVCTSKPEKEPESEEYGAFKFSLDNIKIEFRVAKTTPTKVGQFVTLWKRMDNGPIAPYDIKDSVDIVAICVRNGENFGQFIFPKSILASKNILSKSGKGGKRAIRIYAPWVKTTNSQAANTQSWQTRYFINLSNAKNIDLNRVRRMYSVK